MLHELGTPRVLGSTWAMSPAAVGIVAMPVRAAHEDREPRRDLPGRAGYAGRGWWRLVPGLG